MADDAKKFAAELLLQQQAEREQKAAKAAEAAGQAEAMLLERHSRTPVAFEVIRTELEGAALALLDQGRDAKVEVREHPNANAGVMLSVKAGVASQRWCLAYSVVQDAMIAAGTFVTEMGLKLSSLRLPVTLNQQSLSPSLTDEEIRTITREHLSSFLRALPEIHT